MIPSRSDMRGKRDGLRFEVTSRVSGFCRG